MKINNLLNIFGILIILSSCSNNSNKEKIQDKWWVVTLENNEEMRGGAPIIKFTENKIRNLNDSLPFFEGKIEYSESELKLIEQHYINLGLNGNTQIIKDEDSYSEEDLKLMKEGYLGYSDEELKVLLEGHVEMILEMTDSSFVLQETGQKIRKLYTKASGKDFILGKWTSIDSEKIRMKFDDLKGEGKVVFGKNNWAIATIWTGGLLVLNGEDFTYTFSEDKNNLTLKGNNTIYNLVRSFSGFHAYTEEEQAKYNEMEREAAEMVAQMNAEALNLYSHAKTDWSDTDMGKFHLDESSHIRFNNHPFKGDLSNAEGSGGFNISPSSQDNKYVSINMRDDGFFICDLEKLTSFKLDIYSPYNWLSWGPNNNFVLFHHSYEADGTLFAYNLVLN